MDHELQLLEARQLAQQAAASLAATSLTSRSDRKPRVLLKAATPHAGIGAAAEGSCCALAAATVAIAAARHVATIAALRLRQAMLAIAAAGSARWRGARALMQAVGLCIRRCA